MASDLSILEKNLPLRAYPQEDLNKAIVMGFVPWVSQLLSLSGEKSAERLKNALPALKEQCIGMGFAEIKKMFEMYVDGKLDIEPKTNYFDRVLLGQIVNSYKAKQQQPKKDEPKPLSESEQERIMLDAVDRVRKEVQENGFIEGTAHHVYDFLISTGRMKRPTKEQRKAAHEQAKEEDKAELEKQLFIHTGDLLKRKEFMRKLANYGNGSEITIKRAKTILIENRYKQ